jgi:hypothetical protein
MRDAGHAISLQTGYLCAVVIYVKTLIMSHIPDNDVEAGKATVSTISTTEIYDKQTSPKGQLTS